MILEFGLKSSGMLDDGFKTENTEDEFKNILDLIRMIENENKTLRENNLSMKLRITQLENAQNHSVIF